ncbi:MAG: fatty acyl-AMP ligase [Polyangiales bacterium]
MTYSAADTLVSCLASSPRGSTYGFRFRSLDASERFYSFEALEVEAQRRAAQLAQLDLNKGDKLALVIADPAEFVLSFVAAVVAGIVPVPIYPRASFKAKNAYVETVSHILATSGAKWLLTTESTKPVVEEVFQQESTLARLYTVEQLLQLPVQEPKLALIKPSDLCFLQFTSGSTSLPKGVMVTHENLVANARAFLGPTGVNATLDDLTVTWLPLYHDMGLIGFALGSIVCSVPTLIMPTEAFGRRPNVWLETLHQSGGNLTFAPNFAYALATKRARDKDLEGLDLSHVRLAGCGAEPVNAKVMHEFATRFARCGFRREALLPAYGMAEATLAVTFHPRDTPFIVDRVSATAMHDGHATQVGEDDPAALEIVSCGRAFPGHAVEIIDEQGQTLPERRVGQIITRGPSVTSGYYENPTATAQAWHDGWLHTGDLGYIADGCLYVCGRLKDLIIIRGANYYPQDIEWNVAELEGVRRDNVVAFSVQRGGEETLILCAEANSSDAPALRVAIARKVQETTGVTVGHVAVVRVGSLPKTSSGKVQRNRTKRLFEAGELEEHPVQ